MMRRRLALTADATRQCALRGLATWRQQQIDSPRQEHDATTIAAHEQAMQRAREYLSTAQFNHGDGKIAERLGIKQTSAELKQHKAEAARRQRVSKERANVLRHQARKRGRHVHTYRRALNAAILSYCQAVAVLRVVQSEAVAVRVFL